jgi:hypothetical protein
MKNPIQFAVILSFLLLNGGIALNAQVGIGTSSPESSARLQVDASTSSNAKGFLPPRVSLTALNNIAPFTATPADGILVYNIATAGTAPDNVTPGLYYFVGSRWQRVINDYNGYVGVGTSAPTVRLDARASSGDAAVGIGSSSQTASAAGSGAIRYNSTSGEMEYSNGTSWNALAVGNAPKYAQFRANARQNFSSAGTKMNFQTTVVNIGGFSIATDNTITLPSGRIYRVDLNLGWMTGSWCRFAIYNASTGIAVSPSAHLEEASSGAFAGTGTVSTFINTTSGSITIDVRYLNTSSSVGISDTNNGGNYASITIQTVD